MATGKNPCNGRPFSKRYNELLEKRVTLPCWRAKDEFNQLLKDNQTIVLVGETGSGKTTQMPQFVYELGYAKGNKKIAVTQPRRVAAMSVAARVAEEMDVELGTHVGYLIRFEDRTSEETKIKYMTDGMLLRECMTDPTMDEYGCLVLDEAHERTLSTDILFGLCKEVLKRRPALRCVVMSATLNAQAFQDYFDGAPILSVSGRMFPVEVFYTFAAQKDYWATAVEVCCQIHQYEGPGDILVFLTGEEEIESAVREIQSGCDEIENKGEVSVVPLYGALPAQAQRNVFKPAPVGGRKVVVATNIAETSVTLDGVVFVVDPGFSKQKVYNPRVHIESLLVSPISKAAAKQRAGRAGRTKPGKCFRLFSEDAFNKLADADIPEILRSNLATVILTLLNLGVKDIVHFDFMDPPSPETVMRALEALFFLGAMDADGELTDAGRTLATFPLDPQLGKMLLSASELGCAAEVLSIVAMIQGQPPYLRPASGARAADQAHREFHSTVGDHIMLLKTYTAWSENQADSKQWCWENWIHERVMKSAANVRRQLENAMKKAKLPVNSKPDDTAAIREAIVGGFFMNCAYWHGKRYMTVRENSPVLIHPSSCLQHKPEWVVFNEVVLTKQNYIRVVSTIQAEWLVKQAPMMYHPDAGHVTGDARASIDRSLERLMREEDRKEAKRRKKE
mmetsp:Transcript_19460/g.46952  ORF Transcript_19460/g.46952 Transcript_19460/m.46952 type:complete len:679 (-) Transcript_19460:145-2181(-)